MITIQQDPHADASGAGIFPVVPSGESLATFFAFGLNRDMNDLNKLSKVYKVHGQLVNQILTPNLGATPLCYIRVGGIKRYSINSALSEMNAAVEEGYRRVNARISDLASIEEEDGGVEKAATDTASQVVGYLRQMNVAPPEVSSSGDDAVVMIWKMGDTTYAVTVTDGELGFVVRQARKPVKMVDSIKVQSFLLADLR